MYKMPESKSRSRILLVGNNPELRERETEIESDDM